MIICIYYRDTIMTQVLKNSPNSYDSKISIPFLSQYQTQNKTKHNPFVYSSNCCLTLGVLSTAATYSNCCKGMQRRNSLAPSLLFQPRFSFGWYFHSLYLFLKVAMIYVTILITSCYLCVCISYLSHCPDKINLRKGEFILAQSLRVHSPSWQRKHGGGRMEQPVTFQAQLRSREREMNARVLLDSSLLFRQDLSLRDGAAHN